METSAGLGQEAAKTHLVERHFTDGVKDPFDTVEWSRRDARAGDFFQPNVECPASWSDESIGVVAKLYFATVDGVKETSVRQMIDRVVSKITLEGLKQGHFGEYEDRFDVDRFDSSDVRHALSRHDPAAIFYDELAYICLHQLASFNTPTWLNIGVSGRKQNGMACYPLSVQDRMTSNDDEPEEDRRSITDWWATEAKIFKSGGGSGINLSNIRGSMEPLSTGGVASGPLAYLRVSNAGAETLKSGGSHRRAAKFACLDDDHPDIIDFIQCKVREDERMRFLADAGVNMQPFTAGGERNIAETTSFQSVNISVCASDDFMRCATYKVLPGCEKPIWKLKARVTGETVEVVDPAEMLRNVAEAAWKVADPGLIFIDTLNQWNTTPMMDGVASPIQTVNTCGEIGQVNDSACNLSALNVLKFVDLDGTNACLFKIDDFRHVIDIMATAMDIMCGFAELPTKLITRNTRDLRQLGMGFTNLGAAIMAQGMPYDSDQGRDFAASITALLTGRVYRQSAEMAEHLGAFKHFEANRDAMISIIQKHVAALPEKIDSGSIYGAAMADWSYARARGLYGAGYRNALATAMMPAGTQSFILGASPGGSTGIEPVIALTVEKRLAAAGKMTMVNDSVRLGAQALGGYSEENIKQFAEGDWSACSPEDKATFATALGSNTISPMGHVRMVAAIQPFISQAISKTINVPNEATVDDILEVYTEAWKRGVKTISVYRDGSKSTQVLKAVEKIKALVEEPPSAGAWKGTNGRTGTPEVEFTPEEAERLKTTPIVSVGVDEQIARQVDPRQRMPRTRQSLTHKIHCRSTAGEHEGYIHAGMYEDGRLGEIFIEGFGKQGSFTQNALAAWATDASIGFQYGVPFDVWARKHSWVSDETGGIVVPDDGGEPLVITSCKSIVDYIARWLVSRFGDIDLQEELGVMTPAVKARKTAMYGGGEMNDIVAKSLNPFLDPPEPVKPEVVEPFAAAKNGHAKSIDMGPACNQCGATMHRTGACHTCPSCGATTGCG